MKNHYDRAVKTLAILGLSSIPLAIPETLLLVSNKLNLGEKTTADLVAPLLKFWGRGNLIPTYVEHPDVPGEYIRVNYGDNQKDDRIIVEDFPYFNWVGRFISGGNCSAFFVEHPEYELKNEGEMIATAKHCIPEAGESYFFSIFITPPRFNLFHPEPIEKTELTDLLLPGEVFSYNSKSEEIWVHPEHDIALVKLSGTKDSSFSTALIETNGDVYQLFNRVGFSADMGRFFDDFYSYKREAHIKCERKDTNPFRPDHIVTDCDSAEGASGGALEVFSEKEPYERPKVVGVHVMANLRHSEAVPFSVIDFDTVPFLQPKDKGSGPEIAP